MIRIELEIKDIAPSHIGRDNIIFIWLFSPLDGLGFLFAVFYFKL